MAADFRTTLAQVNLASPSIGLFDETALAIAQHISADSDRGKMNKSTQIRKFYDEVELWNQRVQEAVDPDAELTKQLPYIMMLRAKCAYASSKKQPLVSRGFVDFIGRCLDQLRANPTPTTMLHAKLFFEAVLAFGKQCEAAR
jgi:CRISPR-associated protein Csm2